MTPTDVARRGRAGRSGLGSLAVGLILGVWGAWLFQRGGPCTLHLGFAGVGLLAVAAVCGLVGLVRLAGGSPGGGGP